MFDRTDVAKAAIIDYQVKVNYIATFIHKRRVIQEVSKNKPKYRIYPYTSPVFKGHRQVPIMFLLFNCIGYRYEKKLERGLEKSGM